MNRSELLDIVRQQLTCPDLNGFIETDEGWIFDRRYSSEGMERLEMSPREADWDIIGPAIVYLTDSEFAQVMTDAKK